MCVLRSTKLDQEGAKNQKIKPSDITNNDKQKDKGCANQFFSSLLGNKHPNVQAFGAAQCGVYHPGYDTEAYLRQQANEQLERMVAVLKSTVDQLRWQLSDPTQVFLPAGSAHDAYVEIRKIVQSATSEILIVDPYVDGTLWTLLTNV
ncbi:MAG TPA: hypothetical protein VMG63_25805, partial [Terriglobia bacterium]|nr:hypothetical protein [Terriglobia bacterium]